MQSSSGSEKAQQVTRENEPVAEVSGNRLPRSWPCLSGWGVALTVSLLSIPAWRDYWHPEQSSLTVRMDLPSRPEGNGAALPVVVSANQEVAKEQTVAGQEPTNKSAAVAPLSGTAVAVPAAISAAQAEEKPVKAPAAAEERQEIKAVVVAAATSEATDVFEPARRSTSVQVVDPSMLMESSSDLGVVQKSEQTPEPVKAAETVKEPEPVKAAETVKEPEPVKVEAVKAPESVKAAETVKAPEAVTATEEREEAEATETATPEAQSSRSAQTEKGMDSVFHAGRKAEPIPLDFHFAIQVGSFQERHGALQRAAELRRKGYDAYVQESLDKRNNKQVWQSVRIGRFQDRKTAQNAMEMLRRKEPSMAAFIASNDSYVADGGKDKGGSGAESLLISRTAAQQAKEGTAVGASRQVVEENKVSGGQEAASAEEKANPTVAVATPEITPTVAERKQTVRPEVTEAVPTRKAAERGMNGEKEAAEHLFQQSLAFRNNRDLEQEEQLLRHALQKDGTHTLARNRLARILVESKRVEEGLRLLQLAVQGRSPTVLASEDANLAAFLAALYQRQEAHQQAVDLYESLLRHHPDKGIWRMGLAISLEKMGRKDPALAAYRQALADSDLSANLRRFVQGRIEQLP